MGLIVIQAPLQGEWTFLRPPGHHPDAFDFVQMDDKGRLPHDSVQYQFYVGNIPSSSYYCWNKPVFAPIAGKVIRVGNGWPDHESTNIWKTIQLWFNATFKFRPKEVNGRLDIRPNAGNHVMIQADEGFIVFLAHLKNKSLLVKEGEQVDQGQAIGMVGNSGNSTMPHLHINLFDQMDDPYKAKVLPFVLSRYEESDSDGHWLVRESSLPRLKATIRFS